MLEMIGVGPFITIPVLLASMSGPQSMLGWVLGALIALCDGMVWAELGAAMPGTGGPYHYLSEAYGPRSFGRLLSFLFIWQNMLLGPLTLASGAVGFAQYLAYFYKGMSWTGEKAIAIAVTLLITFLLYRDIRSIGRLSVAMWTVVVATALWIVVTGLIHFDPHLAFHFPPGAFAPSRSFFFGLGGATLIAMYDYGGYNNVCFFAGEIKRPERVIPQAILLSIVAVATIYLTMNVTIVGVIPWDQAVHSTTIVSDFIQRIHGPGGAKLVTVLVLWTALGSLFALLLGLSRVPYAAAVDGRFFKPFARLHPTRNCPGFSLWFLGLVTAVCTIFNLDTLIKALIVIQVLAQSLALVVAIPLIRRRRDIPRPFSMPLYPLTAIVAFAGWLYILIGSGWVFIAWGMALVALGVASYLVRALHVREWPFEATA